ncbi:hypothetical protein GUJ93_ZPchr0003g17934 [Zizania palustris]|uniref:Uncharacterized protein n=1 Tax=Zizania palustris TaxID=103762 RepID=A0A8J5VXJ3_ZIZPA|nr:hypothetical protein GUJ93_ZPchr0003g17934 [Zizania palustris]
MQESHKLQPLGRHWANLSNQDLPCCFLRHCRGLSNHCTVAACAKSICKLQTLQQSADYRSTRRAGRQQIYLLRRCYHQDTNLSLSLSRFLLPGGEQGAPLLETTSGRVDDSLRILPTLCSLQGCKPRSSAGAARSAGSCQLLLVAVPLGEEGKELSSWFLRCF